MDSGANLIAWIEAGKQVGKRSSLYKDSEPYYQSAAIQKVSGIYHVYFFEIPEKDLARHEDFPEVCQDFNNLENALDCLKELTLTGLDELRPLKGQKIFSPGTQE